MCLEGYVFLEMKLMVSKWTIFYLPCLIVFHDLQCMGQESFREEVNVIGVHYHMHNLGWSGTLELIRDGENLGPLFRQGRYDFNHQLPRSPRGQGKVLQPHDKLLLFCAFNSLVSPVTTKFGWGSSEEMCAHYIWYWPEQPLKFCGKGGGNTITLSNAAPRYPLQPSTMWNFKKSSYDQLCSLGLDELYTIGVPQLADQCEMCTQGFASFLPCSGLVGDLTCPRCACFADGGPQQWSNGDCPAKANCSDEDYMALIKFKKETFCSKYIGGLHHEVGVFCQITKEFNPVPMTVWLPRTFPLFIPPVMEPAISTNSDECSTHHDCSEDRYCVNGRMAFTPESTFMRKDGEYFMVRSSTRNVCRAYHLCCQNVDAVGPNGENDDLYPCPVEAECTTWAAKALQCHMENVSNAYCPTRNINGSDYCINTLTQSCKTHCNPQSNLSGYEGGVLVCIRHEDHDEHGNYFTEVTDAPGGIPLLRFEFDGLTSGGSSWCVVLTQAVILITWLALADFVT